MESFNSSLRFDRRMWKADIHGSQAYVKALERAHILTSSERTTLVDGLDLVAKEWETDVFVSLPSDEDIHTANERRLGELVGPVAGKLHTGRSRNDQVATDMRLWLREEGKRLVGYVRELVGAAVERAEREVDVIMPGYTHLQRAQPIRWSHLLLSYAWSWRADAERLEQLLKRMNQLPLGSGALAGNPFNVDRHFLSTELGFDSPVPNSLLGVSDRDFVAEILFWTSLTMVHLSKFSEDLIVYGTSEFGFVTLADAYSTGSSLMPQKKNPDSLELIRGKTGRTFGDLAGFMMTLKGLPSTYNKDLQEDKEPMFDAVDTVAACLQIATGTLSTLTIHPERMEASLSNDMLATDVAEYLVRKGVPFRETHHIAGRAVRLAESRTVEMSALSVADLKTLHPLFDEDAVQIWDYRASIDRRCAVGGTAKETVLEQVEALRGWLKA
ncbi:hypothetical protein HKX48_004244 [Thoreauomyces humboldtii]|nr:hypothetical protein HKX48_004244 [Thoreauomyces humboldtii]